MSLATNLPQTLSINKFYCVIEKIKVLFLIGYDWKQNKLFESNITKSRPRLQWSFLKWRYSWRLSDLFLLKVTSHQINENLSRRFGEFRSEYIPPLQLGSTCDSIRPSVRLHWLFSMTCAHFGRDKFTRKLTQFSSSFGNPVRVDVIAIWRSMKYMMYWPRNDFKGLACICKETWKSVGPPNASLCASSTSGYLGLLASPALFGIGVTCAHVGRNQNCRHPRQRKFFIVWPPATRVNASWVTSLRNYSNLLANERTCLPCSRFGHSM